MDTPVAQRKEDARDIFEVDQVGAKAAQEVGAEAAQEVGGSALPSASKRKSARTGSAIAAAIPACALVLHRLTSVSRI